MKPAPRITGLHHVSMKCDTREAFEKAKTFYTDVLGLAVARTWPEGVLIDTGCGLIEIFCNGPGILQKGAVRHFALSVEDVDALAERIAAAGYEVFIRPGDLLIPSDPPLRARMAFCRGALGEEIELFCQQTGG